MQNFNELIERAKGTKTTIVLPESTDPRVLSAAERLCKHGIAQVILLGDAALIMQAAEQAACDISGVQLLDIAAHSEAYAETLFTLRQHKGLTRDQAREQIADPLIFANVMVRRGEADGCVAGAQYPTADVVRSAMQIVGKHPDYSLVSSFFIMLFDKPFHAFSGTWLFADCALVVDPDAAQLADIASATADTASSLLGLEPRVAMLSFSTQGSAQHPRVEKVMEATYLAKQQRPAYDIFGDVQLDAAIMPEILAKKAPDLVSDKVTNVLVFPDLDAGNIGYKLVQRFAQAEAIGPILQGLNKPVNDLSRGCSAGDIYNVAVITAIQAA